MLGRYSATKLQLRLLATWLCIDYTTITVHFRQGEDVRRLLDFAKRMDWTDPDISWLGKTPVSPVEAFTKAVCAMSEGAGKDDLCLPMWNEKVFRAGRLSKEAHVSFWRDVILVECPDRDLILDNLDGMRPSRYFKHFKGRYMGNPTALPGFAWVGLLEERTLLSWLAKGVAMPARLITLHLTNFLPCCLATRRRLGGLHPGAMSSSLLLLLSVPLGTWTHFLAERRWCGFAGTYIPQLVLVLSKRN